jgi:four helix bundle protein
VPLKMENINGLEKRLFDFTIRTICFLRTLPNTQEYQVIRNQLIRSATSSGANYEESQAGSSRPDFCNKVRISLREMRESNYWFRIIQAIYDNKTNKEELLWLVQESLELKLILGSIVQKTRSKS